MSSSNVKTYKNKRKYPSMNKKDLNLFMELLSIPSSSSNEKHMDNFITHKLSLMGYEYYIDTIGNIIVDKGKAEYKPCVVSHIDTVHSVDETYIKVQTKTDKKDKHTILYSEHGIGGDDKCGIFACFKMLEQFDQIKIIFFTKEETGQIGSNNIDLSEFYDCGYVIQLDRWGHGDFINKYWGQDTTNGDFDNVFNNIKDQYGYKSTEGLITDSITLFENEVGISCVNVSCGYYAHHSKNEYIDVNVFQNSLDFTADLIYRLGCVEYPKPYDVNNYYDSINTNCKNCGTYLVQGEKDLCEWCEEKSKNYDDKYYNRGKYYATI